MNLFRGKNVVVTGGSNGLGIAICKRFSGEGANIFFTYLEDKDSAKKTLEYIKSKGVKCNMCQCDLKNKNDIGGTLDEINKFFGEKVDILINNAGFAEIKSLEEMDFNTIDNLIHGNLTGHIYLTKLLIQHLKNSKGYVVNIASRSGLNGDASCIPYSAAKAGIIGFTKSLARYCGQDIIINSISPSWVNTRYLNFVAKNDVKESISKSVIQKVFEPEEIVDFVIFLCSQRSITGNNIIIDGGGLMQ